MKIRGNKVVWVSKNENVVVTKYYNCQRYFVLRLWIFEDRGVYLTRATFVKQSEAIDYASKIADIPIIEN